MIANHSVVDATRHHFVDFIALLAQDLSEGKISFPTFVDATLKIRRALADENLDAGRLARIVASEPLLAAKLVRTANSVAFNPSGDAIGDVKTAVIRVGMATVRAVAVAVSMEQLESAQEIFPVRERARQIWRHSIDTAAVAYVLADTMSDIDPDEALFAGLVHDIGKFYLLSRVARIAELRCDNEQLDALLADWHASMGSAVLATMDVPPATLAAVNEHALGDCAMPPRNLTDVVVLANMASHAIEAVAAGRTDVGLKEPALGEFLHDREPQIGSLVAALRS
jgi:HD-like signal output (HDOD) protein